MSASTDLLLTLLAFAGIVSLPVLLPWAVITVMVRLQETRAPRPSGSGLGEPEAGQPPEAVRQRPEVTVLPLEEERATGDPRWRG
jgi:hypothetical protein